jgi:hypothetical protein
MAITTNVVTLEGEAFKAISSPIAGCLSKNGVAIPNVKLVAEFVSGSGEISKAIETDHTGTSEFYVTNITSKDNIQELRISIDKSFAKGLPSAYQQLFKNIALPSAKVNIQLKNKPIIAYLYINDDNDLDGIDKHLRNLLVNNHFSITEEPDEAQLFIDITSKMDIGNTVSGGSYDMNVCYCTLTVKIYNNKNEQLLAEYTANRVKVLSPIHKSADTTMAMCIREVMKKVNRELPQRLKKLNLN